MLWSLDTESGSGCRVEITARFARGADYLLSRSEISLKILQVISKTANAVPPMRPKSATMKPSSWSRSVKDKLSTPFRFWTRRRDRKRNPRLYLTAEGLKPVDWSNVLVPIVLNSRILVKKRFWLEIGNPGLLKAFVAQKSRVLYIFFFNNLVESAYQ